MRSLRVAARSDRCKALSGSRKIGSSADESDFGTPDATSALTGGEAQINNQPLAGFEVNRFGVHDSCGRKGSRNNCHRLCDA